MEDPTENRWGSPTNISSLYPTGKVIRILVVTDIHLHNNNIKRLVKALRNNQTTLVDFIVCCGDTCNISDSECRDPLKIAVGEADFASVIAQLEGICSRVVYIPGNHDPATLFEARDPTIGPGFGPQLTVMSSNIHRGLVQIAPGLVVAGFGGSVPAIQHGKERWSGFPYANDREFAREADEFFGPQGDIWTKLEAVKTKIGIGSYSNNNSNNSNGATAAQQLPAPSEQHLSPGEQKKLPVFKHRQLTVLLATHMPPAGSGTDYEQDDPMEEPTYMGSKHLRSILSSPEIQSRTSDMNVSCVIHGHAHRSVGIGRIGVIPIVNPGSLAFGRYSLLEYENQGDAWRIANISLVKLPNAIDDLN